MVWRDDTVNKYNSETEESEEDDFIVDDNGVPLRQKLGRGGGLGGGIEYTDSNMREAQDIFGDGFDMDEFEDIQKKKRDGRGDDDEDDEAYGEDDSNEVLVPIIQTIASEIGSYF